MGEGAAGHRSSPCRGAVSGRRLAVPALALLAAILAAPKAACAAEAYTLSDLDRLPIEDLGKIEVSSVEKTPQPLSDAPASVYVVTHEEIVRSGATRLVDILRLAPNLQVAQITASSDAISARGFNGTSADKLLVLIDGRSVYTPYHNGVFWDAQDVPPEDIERIEVISGPGATLWGANAVNGVINIITRKSGETQGGFLDLSAGDRLDAAALQYGGRLNEDLSYRVYADAASYRHGSLPDRASAQDGWRRSQGGFRLDWTPAQDLLTVQGDIYQGREDELPDPLEQFQFGNKHENLSGGDVLARWTHPWGGGELQVQAYYDATDRNIIREGSEAVRTVDFEVQHSFPLGERQQWVWGFGVRAERDDFTVVPGNPSSPYTELFAPSKRTLTLGDVFAQDTVTLTPAIKLTVGLKLEDDAYTTVQPLPSLRLSIALDDRSLVWTAVSRAIRAPSRLDRDFEEILPGVGVFLKGDDFQPETLIAYEIGYRAQPRPNVSLSVSTYYNVYDDLRSFEPSPGFKLPILFENRMQGETYGIEAWGTFQAAPWWRLSAGAEWMRKDLRYRPGSSNLLGVQIAGDDPKYQAEIGSMMNLGRGVTLDLNLRDVGALPNPASPSYAELDGRIAWAATPRLEVSLNGENLLHDHHLEFGSTASNVQLGAMGVETDRSVYLTTRWRF
jgi:iron complex outermembrane receptor protein